MTGHIFQKRSPAGAWKESGGRRSIRRILFPGLFAGVALSSGLFANPWNYDSHEMGLTDGQVAGSEKKIYYRWHLQNLSRALSPRYIRFMDVEKYQPGKPILRRGVLFTFRAPQAEKVRIAGNFSGWNKKEMRRNKLGIWFALVEPGGEFNEERDEFEYKFNVDGIWRFDPENPRRRADGYGSYFSLFHLENREEDVRLTRTIREVPGHQNPYRKIAMDEPVRLYEFRIHRPEARSVFLAGTFNNWNPDHHPAVKDEKGIWRVRLALPPGEYLYRFIVDGKWEMDIQNPRVRVDGRSGFKASLLKVTSND